MPSLRNSLNIRSRVMWVRAFFNSYKRRVIAAGGVIQNEPCAVRSLNNNLLRSASWTLIPSGIEEDVVFAQKPTSGLGDLTFTRSSDATYTDSTGVVRRSPYNLVTWSEMFSDASWTKSSGGTGIAPSITANTSTSPTGTLTADRLQFNCTGTTFSDRSILFQTITSAVVGRSYTFSVYIKANAPSEVGKQLRFNVDSGTNPSQVITITADWTRYTFAAIAASTSMNALLETRGTVTANTTADVLVWGAQLVEGTSSLDYFPTTNRQDVPRIDFRNADGTLSSCGRLLLEPQRTNSMLYSQLINSWAFKTELTITDNNTISPDGTQNASYIQQTTGGNAVTFQSQNVNVTTGQIQTISFFAKAKEVTSVSFRLGGVTVWSGGVRPTFTCDLTNGTITLIAGTATVSSQNIGNGWYRFVIVTSAVLITTTTTLQTITGAVISPTSGAGFYLWGVQWEQNANYPTTYIPTTTAAVTRLADTASKTGVSSLIGQTAGTIFADLSYIATSTASARWFNVFGTTQHIALASNGINQIRVITNGLTDTLSTAPTSNTGIKIAFAYNNSGVVCFINGTQYTLTNGGGQVMTSLTSIAFDLSLATGVVEAKINQAALIKTRLTNAQLAQLTTL